MTNVTVAPRPSLARPPQEGSPLVWRGRHIGDLLPDGTWQKTISKRSQWCYKFDAPGLQAEVFDSLYACGLVRRVEVHETFSGCIFWLSAEQFLASATRHTLNPMDGEQLFVRRNVWHVEHPEGFQYSLAV